MYLLKIERDSVLIVNGNPYRFIEGGTDEDGTFFGVFVSGIEQVTIATQKKTAITLTDALIALVDLITRRSE